MLSPWRVEEWRFGPFSGFQSLQLEADRRRPEVQALQIGLTTMALCKFYMPSLKDLLALCKFYITLIINDILAFARTGLHLTH